jgi:hypothetical protein
MQPEYKEPITQKRFIDLYEKNRSILAVNDTPKLSEIREAAFVSFAKLGFPDTSLESWRLTDLEESFGRGYDYHLRPI